MIRLLQSSWLTALVGCLLYLGTTLVLFRAEHFAPVKAAASHRSADDDPSWRFKNPEIDQWIAQMKDEKEAVATREQQLNEWQARLDAERQEITTVTQTVTLLQSDFDRNVVRLKAQDADNLKRQVKLISAMSPEGAVAMLGEMGDDDVVRMLFSMKVDEASLMLDTMSKQGKSEARRAALLTARLRQVLPDPTNSVSTTAP
jgi:flagellar motility protein MotE (MotC chaperone)